MSFDQPKSLDRGKEQDSFELWRKCFDEAEAGSFSPAIERNEKGEILAPNGLPSRLPNEDFIKVTRTETFKKWFGDWVNDPENSSKVVHEDTGEPMVVFHGTNKNLPVQEGLHTSNSDSFLNGTIFFTSSEEDVLFWGHLDNRGFKFSDQGVIFSCFLKTDNPFFCNDHRQVRGLLMNHRDTVFQNLNGIIQKKGFVDPMLPEHDQYVVFGSKQVMHLPSNITKGK